MASYQLLGSCDEASREHRRGHRTDTQLQDSSGDADINPFAVYPPFTKWDYVKVFCPRNLVHKELRLGSACSNSCGMVYCVNNVITGRS